MRHARGGVSFGVLVAGAGLVYALAASQDPGRSKLTGLMAGALALSASVLALPLRRVVMHRRGQLFLYAWNAVLCVIIALAISLDGGIESPLTLTLFLPLVYGAMAYPPPAVGVLGAAVIAVYAGIGVAGSDAPGGTLFLGIATLAFVTVMCARTAAIHWDAFARQTELARQLSELAYRDCLTGCLNRRAFHERLDVEVKHSRRHGRPLALLAVDLDGFKAINDVHGHLTGDDLLRTVGAVLQGRARASDVVGRIGGDEFAVLLPDTDAASGVVVAERLRSGIREALRPYPVTASIGVAAGARPARPHDLLEAADAAVYEAKDAGRDAVRVAAPGPSPAGHDSALASAAPDGPAGAG